MIKIHLNKGKYSKWYLNIIQKAQEENRRKTNRQNEKYVYYELHHILPKSIFPEYSNLRDNPWNKVLLTPREHFVCHLLLTKCFNTDEKKYKAIKAFKKLERFNSFQTNRSNSRTYKFSIAEFKRLHSKFTSGEKNPFYGKRHTKETKEKMALYAKNRNSLSKESRERISIARSKSYEITFPTGNKEIITNLTKYCLERNLNRSNILGKWGSKGYFGKVIKTFPSQLPSQQST